MNHGVFPKWGAPQNGWFITENLTLKSVWFRGSSISENLHVFWHRASQNSVLAISMTMIRIASVLRPRWLLKGLCVRFTLGVTILEPKKAPHFETNPCIEKIVVRSVQLSPNFALNLCQWSILGSSVLDVHCCFVSPFGSTQSFLSFSELSCGLALVG